MTAQLVESNRPSLGSKPDRAQRADHPTVVGQNGFPRDGADQEGHEERQDHQSKDQVLVPASLERDDVCQRKCQQQAQHGGRQRIRKGPDDLILVVAERVEIVPEVPIKRQRRQIHRTTR